MITSKSMLPRLPFWFLYIIFRGHKHVDFHAYSIMILIFMFYDEN